MALKMKKDFHAGQGKEKQGEGRKSKGRKAKERERERKGKEKKGAGKGGKDNAYFRSASFVINLCACK